MFTLLFEVFLLFLLKVNRSFFLKMQPPPRLFPHPWQEQYRDDGDDKDHADRQNDSGPGKAHRYLGDLHSFYLLQKTIPLPRRPVGAKGTFF